MIIIDKETNIEIANNFIIDTTEDVEWRTWIIWNTTLIFARPELVLPEEIMLVTKLPEIIAPGDRVEFKVKIDTTKSIREPVKLFSHGTKVTVN